MQFWKTQHDDSELLPLKFMALEFIQKINLGKIRGEENVDDEEEEVKEEEGEEGRRIQGRNWAQMSEVNLMKFNK